MCQTVLLSKQNLTSLVYAPIHYLDLLNISDLSINNTKLCFFISSGYIMHKSSVKRENGMDHYKYPNIFSSVTVPIEN